MGKNCYYKEQEELDRPCYRGHIINKLNSISSSKSLLWLIGNLQVDVSRKKQFDWLQLSQRPMSSSREPVTRHYIVSSLL